MSPKLLSVRTAEVSVNKATEARAFHYLNPLSAGNKNHIKEENSLKKQFYSLCRWHLVIRGEWGEMQTTQ